MNSANNSLYNHYGAYALKAKYQANLVTSQLMVVGSIALALVAIALWPREAIITVVLPHAIPRDSIVTHPVQPPTIKRELPKPNRSTEPVKFSIGIPVPVDVNDSDINNQVLATIDQLRTINGIDSIGPNDGLGTIDTNLVNDIPGPTDFVPCEIYPRLIQIVQPIYPELARQAQLEGNVTLRVLVDTVGNVHDVIITKSSGLEALDNAAVKAAWLCRYSPGIQSDRPVFVWVTYPVKFELDR